jgi:hypothetical protein
MHCAIITRIIVIFIITFIIINIISSSTSIME